MNTYIRLASAMLCLLFVLTALGGCTVGQTDGVELSVLENKCGSMLDALLANDADAGYALMESAVSREGFDTFFAQSAQIFDGAESYRITEANWQKKLHVITSSDTAVFRVELPDERTFDVTCKIGDSGERLSDFSVVETYDRIMDDTPMWQKIAFVVLSVLFMAFAVWMMVDCIKRKPDAMAMWIMLFLCSVNVSFSVVAGETAMSVGVTLFAYLSTVGFADGALLLDVAIPVFPIVYFFLRKKLPAQKSETETQTYTELSAEESDGK